MGCLRPGMAREHGVHEGGAAQAAGASGRQMPLRVARPAQAGLGDGGRGDQSAAGLCRANRGAVDAVPGLAVVRPEFAAGVVPPPTRGHIVVPRIGLVFPRQMPFEAWLGVGAHLAAVAASSAWCLGDWLVYGQAAYGSRYRQAAERTGLDYQTLRNYAWVAGRFELSRRRDTLSFGHHAEVAALPAPEQDFWLRKAEESGWSTRRLRREVRASLAERRQEPVALEPARKARPPQHNQRAARQVTVRVTLTPQQLELCEQAACSAGMTIIAWAARALERAAHESWQYRDHDRPAAK